MGRESADVGGTLLVLVNLSDFNEGSSRSRRHCSVRYFSALWGGRSGRIEVMMELPKVNCSRRLNLTCKTAIRFFSVWPICVNSLLVFTVKSSLDTIVAIIMRSGKDRM